MEIEYEQIISNSSESITKSIEEILLQGLRVIEKIDDRAFTEGGRGGIGIHFRHCLDFVTSFLNGIKIGKIDYSQRERNTDIETNPQLAILNTAFVICKLQLLKLSDLEKPLMVKIEEISSLTGKIEWAWSSGLRELDFLQSHLIHHFAQIADKLRALGIEVEEEFGVAPSTLKYWQAEKAKAA